MQFARKVVGKQKKTFTIIAFDTLPTTCTAVYKVLLSRRLGLCFRRTCHWMAAFKVLRKVKGSLLTVITFYT